MNATGTIVCESCLPAHHLEGAQPQAQTEQSSHQLQGGDTFDTRLPHGPSRLALLEGPNSPKRLQNVSSKESQTTMGSKEESLRAEIARLQAYVVDLIQIQVA